MWLIYALGGGWGHLTRAASLARAARTWHQVRILTNSPSAGVVASAAPELDLHILDPAGPIGATRAAVLDAVTAAAPACFIVDTFPRGLGGELADVLASIGALKVLVHRDLNPRYVTSARLREFVQAHYDLILVPGRGEGEAFGHLPQAVTTEPWLIRSRSEIAATGGGAVAVSAAGNPSEAEWYGAVAEALQVEGIPVRRTDRQWPAIDLFAGASVVVGCGGYNTVHECLALGVPLVAKAWPRKYDRQEVRLTRASRRGSIVPVDQPREAVAAVRAILRERTKCPTAPAFANGVHEAVALIGKRAGAGGIIRVSDRLP